MGTGINEPLCGGGGGGVNAFVFGKTSLFFFKHKDIYCIVFALWLT